MSTEFDVSPQEIARSCLGDLHPQARYGLELFNRHEYFEAHEALELAWRAERGPERELYRGILQVAVAYYHIQRGNYKGAVKMFLRLRTWLDPFPDQCRGIDLAGFRKDYHQVEEVLHRLGPAHVAQFDRSMFKPIQFD